MDEKAFKLGSFLTAAIAAVIPLTTGIAKVLESDQQAKKFEHESQMRYIDLLVSDGGQRDWYFRRDVLSFYSEVLPQDHPVKAWARKELEVAERQVEKLEGLKAEQLEAELELSRELIRTGAEIKSAVGPEVTPAPEPEPAPTSPPKTPSTPKTPTPKPPETSPGKVPATSKVEAATIINRQIAMQAQRGALPMTPTAAPAASPDPVLSP